MLPAALMPFVQQRPIAFVTRAILERFLDPTHRDALFRRTAVMPYERSLLFSSVVDVLHSVVLGLEPSVFAADRKRQATLPRRTSY